MAEPEKAETPEKPETPEAPEAGEPTATPAASAGKDGPTAPKCNATFRKGLLAKLPKLAYSTWTVTDSFKLDDEWNAVVSTNADAVLEPLETVAPTRTDAPPRSGT